MSDTWDAEDRAIARALGAASEEETRGADDHLTDRYRDVLAEMPIPEVEPRPELEDRVVAAALARRPAAVPALDRARAKRRRVRVGALVAAVAAAAVVVGLIVANPTPAPTTGGHLSLTTVQREDIDALVSAPGSRTGDLGPSVGRAVVATNGQGAIYDLPANEPGPLQIGLVSKGGTTLLAPTEPAAGAIGFDVDHPERVTAVTLLRGGQEIGRATLTPS